VLGRVRAVVGNDNKKSLREGQKQGASLSDGRGELVDHSWDSVDSSDTSLAANC
jgi:hypothetical protein